ncbi:Predicted oxidoreductase [Micromonospora phaseoli]|uniref:Predicted oxidoreductase n=1 Tax=Micromonospora phaseoli TaxID=1144548 RepID=A0A1H7CVU7_9ACTN|nr:aldo/keto reductase [Micromonospora phaseoli]PZV91646.1 aryl-alcohol dehydrogenase-like predicted oxidoreductase [Micromonospora phaseoli]GIJ79277.1 putative oxidoreductase [Micromonospora phaseoli]SEJ91332.1 Predicted oxidoreductase [Micromonospora phaseoli]
MRYVRLDTPKPLSKIGLGTWQFGSREWGYGPDYERLAAQIVRRAVELGVTVFDTAELYGFGRSERILGAALAADRDKVVVATKIFPVLPVASVVQQRAVASAARLGVTSIDLYQVHQPNPVVNDHRTMLGMRGLQDVGLVGEVGVSNYSLRRWQVAEAALGRRVLSNQVRYSMLDRKPEADLLPYAEQAGRLVIAYSPLAQGFLSGRYDANHPPTGTVRRANPYFLPENLERGTALIETLRQVAAAHDATPSQIALAYVLRHPNVVAIPGASTVEQLERNAAAAEIDLTEDEYAALVNAARAFRPITGLAALPRMLKARAGR